MMAMIASRITARTRANMLVRGTSRTRMVRSTSWTLPLETGEPLTALGPVRFIGAFGPVRRASPPRTGRAVWGFEPTVREYDEPSLSELTGSVGWSFESSVWSLARVSLARWSLALRRPFVLTLDCPWASRRPRAGAGAGAGGGAVAAPDPGPVRR